jgi:hypothetical protein
LPAGLGLCESNGSNIPRTAHEQYASEETCCTSAKGDDWHIRISAFNHAKRIVDGEIADACAEVAIASPAFAWKIVACVYTSVAAC